MLCNLPKATQLEMNEKEYLQCSGQLKLDYADYSPIPQKAVTD